MRLAGDIPYRLRGASQPTQGCNRSSSLLANPQARDNHSSSVLFDGVDDSAFLFPDVDLGIGNVWTVMAWVAPLDLAPVAEQMIYNIGEFNGTANNSMELVIEAGGLFVCKIFNSTGVLIKKRTLAASGFFFDAGSWAQICVTWDGSTMKVYRNGTFMNALMLNVTDVGGFQTNTDRSLCIGNRASPINTSRFNGYVHSSAHWNVALAIEQIRVLFNQGAGSRVDLNTGQDDYTSQDNLRSWYKFGQVPSTIGSLEDFSGNLTTNMLTTNSASQMTRSAPEGCAYTTEGTGQVGRGVQFQGVANSQTIAAWCKPATLPAEGVSVDVIRFAVGVTTQDQLAISLTTSGGQSFWVYEISDSAGATINTVVGTTPVVAGDWYHVTGCKTGTAVIRLFVNALDDITPVLAGIAVTSNASRSSHIGYDGRGINGNFDGDIGSIALWDLAISEASVKAVYNGGWRTLDLRASHPCYSESTNLVHWWVLGQGDTGAGVGDDTVTDLVPTGYDYDVRVGVGADEQNFLTVDSRIQGTAGDFDIVSGLSIPTALPVGIANTFTVSMWMLPRDITVESQYPMYIGPSVPSTFNHVSWQIAGTTSGDPFVVKLVDSGGAPVRTINYTGMLVLDEWQHLMMVWDGVEVVLYHNGAVAPGAILSSGGGSLINSSRFVDIGGSPHVIGLPNGLKFDGRIGHVGIWNAALTEDEAVTMYSRGTSIDLRYNNGDYQSGEFLQHYYKLGEDRFVKGRDFTDSTKGDSALALTSETGSVPIVGDAP